MGAETYLKETDGRVYPRLRFWILDLNLGAPLLFIEGTVVWLIIGLSTPGSEVRCCRFAFENTNMVNGSGVCDLFSEVGCFYTSFFRCGNLIKVLPGCRVCD